MRNQLERLRHRFAAVLEHYAAEDARFRYLLTRQHGLGAGIDLAYGPEDSVLTFGSA